MKPERRVSGDREAVRERARHTNRWTVRWLRRYGARNGRANGQRYGTRLRTGHRLATEVGTWNFFGSQEEQAEKSDAARVPATGTVEAGAAYADAKVNATGRGRRKSSWRQRRAAQPTAETRHGSANGTAAERGPARVPDDDAHHRVGSGHGGDMTRKKTGQGIGPRAHGEAGAGFFQRQQ